MRVIVVGHVERMNWIEKLQEVFPACSAVIDYRDRGALQGHISALEVAAKMRGRTIIMEDDAIPVQGFAALSERWFDRHPDDLISFYLGTGRPPQWQPRVDKALAVRGALDYIKLPQLIHGVCYSVPEDRLPTVLAKLKRTVTKEADYAIGNAWGGPVVYPVESLVEHRDDGTVEKHADGMPRVEKRVARMLAGPLMYGS